MKQRRRLCELRGWKKIPIPCGYRVAESGYAGCESRYFRWLGRDAKRFFGFAADESVMRGKIIRILVDDRLDRYAQTSTGKIELVETDG